MIYLLIPRLLARAEAKSGHVWELGIFLFVMPSLDSVTASV